MRVFSLVVAFLFCVVNTEAQTKTSTKNGNWSDPTSWSPAGVPTSINNVIITSTHTISIDVNATCNNLQVGAGAAAALRFSGNTNRILTVSGNFTNNATVDMPTNSNATHTVVLLGDLINNSFIDLNIDGNSRAVMFFSNTTALQTVTGAGVRTEFYTIRVSKGAVSNFVDFQTTNFTVPSSFLILTSGTIKFSFGTAKTLVPATAAFTIPSGSGIWLNSGPSVVSFSAGVTLAGRIKITEGNMDIGNATNEDLVSNGGVLEMSAGTLDIAGKYRATTTASTFSLTGGVLKVPSVATSNTGIAPFTLSAPNSTFVMSSGTIIIRREGGNGTQDLGYVNTGATVSSVTGGTLQLGDVSTPGSQTVGVNSSIVVPCLVIASPNITGKLITNSLSVLNDIEIRSGSLNANALSINVGGNWRNTGTFVPSTGTVNFVGNSAQTITRATAENFNTVTFSGSGPKTLQAPLSVASVFSIAVGTDLDVSTSNYSVSVNGNFINHGALNTRNGLIRFSGTTAQSIGGTAITDFYDLTITNASGVTLNSAANLKSILTLTNGVLNTGTQVFTLKSDATGTARVGPITGTGNLNGNVTVQRFMPGGATGWALLGSPISSALTLNDWDDDMVITCPTCPDGFANFNSVYTYSEAATGVYDSPTSYVPLSSINDAVTGGKGYWLYLGNAQFTTTPITSDVTGTIRKFAFAIPLSRTNTGSAVNDGWNLIANPYPCPISWNALRGATANLDNAIYTYNADLNGGTGGYASFVNGVSSPAVNAGGIGDAIPQGQGFYVHSTGATLLTAQETHKLASNDPTFLRPSAVPSVLRLNLRGGSNFTDETALYYEANASNGVDAIYDAYKVRGQDPSAPTIALYSNQQALQINGVPAVSGTFTTELLVLTGYTGSYTLSASDFTTLPKGTCFSIYDRATNTNFDLNSGNYVFNLADTTSAPRFVLKVSHSNLQVNAQVQQPSCSLPNGGKVVAQPQTGSAWSYYWTVNGQPVRTSLNKTSADTLANVSNGNFQLEVFTQGACDYSDNLFSISAIETPQALFACEDTAWVNFPFNISDLSTNSQNYVWNFGDGTAPSNVPAPIHSFANLGLYKVSLIVESSTSCLDSMHTFVRVVDEGTGIREMYNTNGILLKNLGANQFQVQKQLEGSRTNRILVMNNNGQVIVDNQVSISNKLDYSLNLDSYSRGIYSITIFEDNQKTTVRVVVQD